MPLRFLLALGLLCVQVNGAHSDGCSQCKEATAAGLVLGAATLGVEFFGIPVVDRYLTGGSRPGGIILKLKN